MLLRVFIDDHANSEGFAVHKENGDQQGKDQDGNTDGINMSMC